MRKVIILAAGLTWLPHGPAAACTLWGAAGSASAGGEGTLLAKNRDWKPDHQQSLRLVHPASGFAYLGLFADGSRVPGIKAGVNQQGLSVVSASASSLPREARAGEAGEHGVMRQLLRRYATLEAVAADAGKLFGHARPVFLQLADPTGLMLVEVGQHGRYRLQREANGVLTHTNHYRDAGLLDQPQSIGRSSASRLSRIDSLLSAQPSHTRAEFSAISQDRHDGPDDSLWRSGREHTLANWQVSLPVNAAPRLRLVLANPGAEPIARDYVLDAAFWRQAGQRLLP
ncbi:carcinine hydrolase/isopenicillin-N N-acyltransferase family protein [Chromobacterium sphagni]|uniref:Peptidase C45 hydrolase domain-containing protein n=1 Tax=Chromobacterium sphagni TaxID=1903179 RepID=A0ABX3C8P4_9NEIS|nr:carcinine hydrolase/isopenicillin-N N-acyltransferase family protein [Chromobacterium sphagni]OHX17329.1 hypothetical protein BI344_20900 [Chromobacterium sphagni]